MPERKRPDAVGSFPPYRAFMLRARRPSRERTRLQNEKERLSLFLIQRARLRAMTATPAAHAAAPSNASGAMAESPVLASFFNVLSEPV